MTKNLKTPSGYLQYEIERLLTFSENSHPKLTATELAANGYYYDNTGGKIMCFFCKSILEFSDSTFKHKYSCRHKDDSIPFYEYDDTVIETNKETETLKTNNNENFNNSSGNEIPNLQKRLDTFRNWNTSIPVTPTDLAKNGFYYLGYGGIVECAYCSLYLHNWKENYDVHKEHARLSPTCPILRYFREINLEHELNWQKSFVKWPTNHPLKAKDLAANGFYYKGPADNVCCIFCKYEIKNWKANDNIKEKHKSISPKCPFLCEKLVDNLSISNQSNKFDYPIHPHFASSSERLKTFSSWPKNKSQKPESLADAGFFHNGKSDTVICFCCGEILCDWDEDEEPWHKHAQYSPNCTFVQQMKNSKNITEASWNSKVSSNNQELENANSYENYSSEPTEGSSSVNVTAFSNTSASAACADLIAENNLLKEQKLCKFCLDEELNVVFLPCGHLVSCASCAPVFSNCPACQKKVNKTQVYANPIVTTNSISPEKYHAIVTERLFKVSEFYQATISVQLISHIKYAQSISCM